MNRNSEHLMLSSRRAWWLLLLGWSGLFLAGCSAWNRTAPFIPPVTSTPFYPLPPTSIQWPTATPSPSPTPLLPTYWTPPGLSWALEGWRRVQDPSQARVRLVVNASQPQGYRVFVLAVPVFQWAPEVRGRAVHQHWQGAPSPLGDGPLLMTPETRAWLEAAWGPPAEGRVETVPPEELLEQALTRYPGWVVLPWEDLTPSWRVAQPLETSPLMRGYDPTQDPLALPLAWTGSEADLALWQRAFPLANRDPSRLTVVALTGVTALVRATAYTMEIKGLTYPAEEVGPLLARADITHINNEVPFDPNCPPPNPMQQGLKFCSDPRYIVLLETVGTDVVEVAGDHFNDRGPEAMRFTLEMYRERGWAYYGGGENLEDARRPARIEHNGNRIAFVGCNAKGGGYATAAPDYPGAWACDWDVMERQVRSLRAEGYLPIVTFQHQEIYLFDPPEDFKADFRRMAEAGAVVVSGSQAHHPHGMEIYQGAFITYGLGNLFFDQRGVVRNGDKAFIVLHVFYENRHLGTRWVPLQFVDFAKPRILRWEEARPWMEQVLNVSRWNNP